MSIKPSAHFLYSPDNGDWTGIVRRHEGAATKYDRCDTAKGTAFWWTQYQNDGYLVSAVNATKYDLQQPLAVGGGIAPTAPPPPPLLPPTPPTPPRELFFECGHDRIAHEATDTWTGRIVDQDRNVLYDLTQFAHMQWHMTRAWVRALLETLRALRRTGVTTFSPTSLGAVSLVLGVAHQDVGMPATSPVERFFKPVTPLTDEELREHQAMIERSKRTPLTKGVLWVVCDDEGVPAGPVLNDETGENISAQFKDVLQTRDAYAWHTETLGYEVKFKPYTRAEELKHGEGPKLVEQAEPGYTLFTDDDTAAAKAAEADVMARYSHKPLPTIQEGDVVDEVSPKQKAQSGAPLSEVITAGLAQAQGVHVAPGGPVSKATPEPLRRVWYFEALHTLCTDNGPLLDLRERAPNMPASVAEQLAAHLDALWGSEFENALALLDLTLPKETPFEAKDEHVATLVVAKVTHTWMNVRIVGAKGKTVKELEGILQRFAVSDFDVVREEYKKTQPAQISNLDIRYGSTIQGPKEGPLVIRAADYDK